MACCLIILLLVRDEVSYDALYSNADRIYRLAPLYYRTEPKGIANANSPIPAASAMARDLTGIARSVRVYSGGNVMVNYNGKIFTEERMYFADKEYFQMFASGELPFLAGNPQTALVEPFSIVITDEIAAKYFGSETPKESMIGKMFRVDNADVYRITGIIKAPQKSVHLRFDGLFSFSTIEAALRKDGNDPNTLWGFLPNLITYIELQQGTPVSNVESQLPAFVNKYLSTFMKDLNVKVKYSLQPLRDIHLYPQSSELQPQSSARSVSIFGGAALFILAIACINFMNLATARSQQRAKEVGVRKTVGARRGQLIWQFLTEAVFISLLALVIALVMVELTLPLFNAIMGKTLSVGYTSNVLLVISFVGMALLVGIAAGSYPAFILSGFAPIGILKGRYTGTISGALVRKTLVVAQFTISIILIVATIVVFRQLEFARNKDLGLNTAQVVKIALPQDSAVAARLPSIMQAVSSLPGIQQVSAANNLPGDNIDHSTLNKEGGKTQENQIIAYFTCEANFIPTMKMHITQGRNFSEKITTDRTDAFIINEATVKAFGLKDPIGKRMVFSANRTGTVIGVVKDFHFESMYSTIRPAILMMPKSAANLRAGAISVDGANLAGTLAQIEKVWKKSLPDWTFEYSFVDQNFAKLYNAEQRLGSLFGVFAALAIVLACLGLFGLAAYSAEVRRKEIGVRKVLGASAGSIIRLLSKDFLLLVGIAIVIALPLAWHGMNTWLQDFAYRVELSWWVFALAAASSVVIAFLTVAGQSWRAAGANPVQSLRSE